MAPTVSNMVVGLQTDNTVKLGLYGVAEGSLAELGLTDGGIAIENAREYLEKKADQYTGVLDVVKTSERMTVKFNIAEATIDNLRLAWDMPAGAIAGSVFSSGGDATATNLTLFINCKSVGGNARKYEFLKVVCVSAGAHSYKKDEVTMIEMEFLVMQDTSATADQQMCIITDSGVDTTAPTIVLSTPADGGTVADATTGPVVWTITEAGTIIDENTVIYGDSDKCTFMILNTSTPATTVLVAGTIVYDATAKTVTFTPDVVWTTAHTFQAIVTTGLRDMAGNHLAAIKIEQFSAT